MRIVDFDTHFFKYAQKWVAAHPNLTEKQIDESYNKIMAEWMRTEAEWLEGATPETYFNRFDTAEQLIDLVKGYFAKNINLPEPLYTRIVEKGEECGTALMEILKDSNEEEALRAETLGMLRDIGTKDVDEYLVELILTAQEDNELSNMAADIISTREPELKRKLLDSYPNISEYAQTLVLDICSNGMDDPRVYEYLIDALRNRPEQRALYASYLGKLGDERAIEPMKQLMSLFDISYFDYIELRDAVEALGGEVTEERTFYGDPDYEALRNIE